MPLLKHQNKQKILENQYLLTMQMSKELYESIVEVLFWIYDF